MAEDGQVELLQPYLTMPLMYWCAFLDDSINVAAACLTHMAIRVRDCELCPYRNGVQTKRFDPLHAVFPVSGWDPMIVQAARA